MLKITQTANDDGVMFKLEGKLLGPWVDEARRACIESVRGGKGQSLDLSAVIFADAAGAQLIRELLGGGATLAGCSHFISELLGIGEAMTTLDHRPEAIDSCAGRDTDPSNWAVLIARIRAGQAAACEEFVRRYGGRMTAVARRLMRSEDDAADAVQDAFVSAFRSLDRFEGQSKIETWLHRIVVNACLMKLRSKRGRNEVSIESLLPAFDETGHHARPVAAWRSPPREEIESSELQARVRACIDQLPESYRTVLILRDIEQLDTQETAERLGINCVNVKVRLHRARQALRTLLEPYFAAGTN